MCEVDGDDEFEDLYADVALQASSALNAFGALSQLNNDKDDCNVQKKKNPEEGFNLVLMCVGESSGCLSSGVKAEDLGGGDGGKEMNVDDGSDSEDELNIVLNDDGCKIPVSVSDTGGSRRLDGGHDGEGNNDLVVAAEGPGLGTKGGDFWLGDRSQAGLGGNGYRFSQNKSAKHQVFAFQSKRGLGWSPGAASFAKGESEDIARRSFGKAAHFHARGNSGAGPSGYAFSLPRSKTILDVDIDSLEEKPWRYPGIDTTDFFNFGFNEDSWRVYSSYLGQFRQYSYMMSRIPVYGPTKVDQVNKNVLERCQEVQDVFAQELIHNGFTVPLSSGYTRRKMIQMDMLREKALEGEDCTGKPGLFVDLKHPGFRDSDDVVIQIIPQDSLEDASDSGKMEPGHITRTVHETSENVNSDADGREIKNGDLDADERDIHSSAAGQDELSVECPEDVRRSDGSSTPKRYSQLTAASNSSPDSENHRNDHTGVSQYRGQKLHIDTSEGITTMKNVSEARGDTCHDLCSPDPCRSEKEIESSLSGRCQLSPTLSCFGSESEAYEFSEYVDPERQSQDSGNELHESATSERKNSYCSGSKEDRGANKTYIRNRTPVQHNTGHHNGRPRAATRSEFYFNDGASPSSNADGFYERDNFTPRFSRRKERWHQSSFYDKRNSYHRGRQISCDEKSSYYHFQNGYAKCIHKKRSFPNDRKELDERNDVCGQRNNRVEYDDMGPDYAGRRLDENMISQPRNMFPKFSPLHRKERDSRCKANVVQPRKRKDHNGYFKKYDMRGKRRYFSLTDKDICPFDNENERQWSFNGRDVRSSKRWCRFSNSLDPNKSWSEELEEGSHRHLDSWSYIVDGGRWENKTSVNDGIGRRVTERLGRCERRLYPKEGEDGGWFSTSSDHRRSNERVNSRRRYNWSKGLQWTGDSEEVPDRYRSYHGQLHIANKQLQARRYNRLREGNNSLYINRRSDVIDKSRYEQPLIDMSCRDSFDMGIKEEKFLRPFRRVSKGGISVSKDSLDTMRDESWDAIHDFDRGNVLEPHVRKLDNYKYNEESVGQLQGAENIEDIDIEEGQIVTEDPGPLDSGVLGNHFDTTVSKRHAKERICNQSDEPENNTIAECNNQRIMEAIEKMQKRKERFKEPITLKESDQIPHPQLDITVNTTESKQQRPARKRRWLSN